VCVYVCIYRHTHKYICQHAWQVIPVYLRWFEAPRTPEQQNTHRRLMKHVIYSGRRIDQFLLIWVGTGQQARLNNMSYESMSYIFQCKKSHISSWHVFMHVYMYVCMYVRARGHVHIQVFIQSCYNVCISGTVSAECTPMHTYMFIKKHINILSYMRTHDHACKMHTNARIHTFIKTLPTTWRLRNMVLKTKIAQKRMNDQKVF
jgi:hypothetical protein